MNYIRITIQTQNNYMKKAGPFSVRIDQVHFDFVKEQSALGKAQELVSFLFQEYYVRNKLVKEQMQNMVAGFPMLPAGIPQQGGVQQVLPKPFDTKIDQYQAYTEEIDNATGVWQIEAAVRELKKEPSLTPAQKLKLEQYAKDKSAQID